MSWAGLPGFLVGALLLLLRPAASISLAAVIAASMGWYTWTVFHESFEIVYTMVATTLTGPAVRPGAAGHGGARLGATPADTATAAAVSLKGASS